MTMFSTIRTLGLAALCAVAVRAADEPRDVLVYSDGDRVTGRLVETGADGMIVFKSERFGELRVPARQAVVEKAPPDSAVATTEGAVAAKAGPAEKTATARPQVALAKKESTKAAAKAAEPVEEESGTLWERFSPRALTEDVRKFFGPWRGRIALSNETVADAKDRSNSAVEVKMARKWTADDVQVNGRYDYNKTNDATTTDTVKADALWRHDFPQKVFSQYRPTVEWNRASVKSGKPADYLLLQQEVGAGVNLYGTSNHKVRLGVSENLFDVWTLVEPTDHSSRAVESAFVETDWKMPWRLALTQRGVWYYSRMNQRDGWESKVELNKKLTETLSAGVRHEIRRDSPDERVQDYTKLKVLLGLDF